jgi:hypothetical protein
MAANPAQMGMPEISKPNALPNNRAAMTYSFMPDRPFARI